MIAEKRKIIKWRSSSEWNKSSFQMKEEWLAIETILKISVNAAELVSFSCSPVDCEDLAIGFLFTEGIITALEDIDHIITSNDDYKINFVLTQVKENQVTEWKKSTTLSSGCGQGVISNPDYRRERLQPVEINIDENPHSLSGLFKHMKLHSEWYERTGCIHQVSLFNSKGSVIIREDIGRHNAVDKVIGAAIQCKINFEKTILSCSGRLSSDMVLKAARARIPVVISRAAPTSLAVDIADDSGITLIGFARGSRMNIYTHSARINLHDNQYLCSEKENFKMKTKTANNIINNQYQEDQ